MFYIKEELKLWPPEFLIIQEFIANKGYRSSGFSAYSWHAAVHLVVFFPVFKVAERKRTEKRGRVSSLHITVTRRYLGADASLQKVPLSAQDITMFHARVSVWTGRWLGVTMLAGVQGVLAAVQAGKCKLAL